ncbi:MAG: T9SS type A sorting domain-containing protein [Flavobacteriales bacterium]|nr:T9SS type A sorting domain-containing protein [Flavobacteriales bacterium]
MTDWVLYNNGLPAQTPVVFMQNHYCEGKVRVAGSRGVHEAPVMESSSVVAAFTANKLKINLGVQCEADTIRFTDNSAVLCMGAQYQWTFEAGQANTLTEETVFVVYDSPGYYDVSLTVTDADGNMDTVTWPDLIEVVDEPVGFPIAEDFNDEFPPEHWKLYNPEGGGTWEHGTVLADPSDRVAQFPNYWVNTSGETDLLIMPAQDFTDVDDPQLFFDVSYQTYAEYVDGLAVWFKTNPNDDWGVLYEKLGSELAVENNYTWFWYDEGGEILWRTDTVDLAPLAGENCVTLAFANIGGYGNHIWLDNVNLTTPDAVDIDQLADDKDILVYPNPAQEFVNIRIPSEWGVIQGAIYDSRGKLVAHEQLNTTARFDTQDLVSGLYNMVFTVEGRPIVKRILIQ